MQSVLFVDDNEMLCRLACDILRREGFHAVPAFSAADALQAYDRETFDVVVTDFRMESMDGLQLARELRGRSTELPIIVVSGYEALDDDNIRIWIPKEALFPAVVEEIRLCLAEVGKTCKAAASGNKT